jgi:hypothetical protein
MTQSPKARIQSKKDKQALTLALDTARLQITNVITLLSFLTPI